jgi:hypothetical protein
LDARKEPAICNFEEPTAATSDSQLMWEAGILLVLRQKFYLPFEALFFSIDAFYFSIGFPNFLEMTDINECLFKVTFNEVMT